MGDVENPIIMNHEVNCLFNMFKNLLYHDKSDNKVKQSIFKVKESTHSIRLVTYNEMSVILNALDKQRDRLLYKLLYLTGARIQEALDLEIESVPVPDMPYLRASSQRASTEICMCLCRLYRRLTASL
ncbi:MAG: hypothetical protein K2G83_01115 [Ruminococcus sp.]|nr:hypothetical protein [Ruminococcus sp.]